MTTEELSQKSTVPVGTINKLFTGETKNPTGKTASKLAKALDVTVEYLLNDNLPIDFALDNILDEQTSRLVKAITKSKLSLSELSKLTGIPKATLQKYVTGEIKDIPNDNIDAIANATGVTSDYLKNGNNQPDTKKEPTIQTNGELIRVLEERPMLKKLFSILSQLDDEHLAAFLVLSNLDGSKDTPPKE